MEGRGCWSRGETRKTIGRSGVWRWVGRWSLALTPLLALGCYPQSSTLPLKTPAARSDADEAERLSKLPKRIPSPNLCLETGKLQELKGDAAETPPAEKAMCYDKARKAYQEALRQDPKFTIAARSLAEVYVKENNPEMALTTYQKILKEHPQDATLWYDLAACQAKHKAFEPALESLGRALQIDPENRPYLTFYGHLLARSGRYDDAVVHFSRLVGPAKAYYQVARMQQHLQRTDLAVVNLQRAIQADPNMGEARQLLASLSSGQPQAPGADPGLMQVGHQQR